MSGEVREIAGFGGLLRITSDSRIWTSTGRLGQCRNCGLVQKPSSAAYRQEVGRIYDGYNLYFQGRGEEQKIFRQGIGAPRSALLADHALPMLAERSVQSAVRWLDLGCGRGHLLRALAARRPAWGLYGADISEKSREAIESIPGIRRYFANGLDDVDEVFDVLSMSHVLEHIPEPPAFLRAVRARLADDGLLVVAVPDWRHNPFDLLVADHCLHFSLDRLTGFLHAAGFEVLSASEETIPKELVVLARPACQETNQAAGLSPSVVDGDWLALGKSIAWLSDMTTWATAETRSQVPGLLGTALAATWLDASCQSRFGFFVEEDPDRAGSTYMGRPVYAPDSLPPDARVLVPLPPGIAANVCERLNRPGSARFVSI